MMGKGFLRAASANARDAMASENKQSKRPNLKSCADRAQDGSGALLNAEASSLSRRVASAVQAVKWCFKFDFEARSQRGEKL